MDEESRGRARGDAPSEGGWGHALRALKDSKDFRRAYGSLGVALVGRTLQGTAVSWLVYDLTRSPTALGLLELAVMGPGLVVGLAAGTCADRVAPRRLIVATQAVQFVLALVLGGLVASGHVRAWHLFVLLAASRMADVLQAPSQQLLTVGLIGREQLSSSVPLDVGMFNVASALGPAGAGVCLGLLGGSSPFWIAAATAVPLALVVLALRVDWTPCRDAGRGFGAIVDVGRHVVGDRRLLGVVGLVLGFGAAGMGYDAVLSAYARDYVGLGALGFGGLVAVEAVGAALGALAVAWVGERVPRGLAIAGGMGVFALGVALSAALPRHPADAPPRAAVVAAAAACLAAIGFGRIVFFGSSQTLVQLVAPEALRGRLTAMWTAAFSASCVLGALWMGPMTERLGIRPAFLVAAGSVAALALASYAVILRRSGVDPKASESSVLAGADA